LSKHGFEVLESRGPVYRETAQLSMRHGTVYDAAYVALYEHRLFKEQETVIDDDDAEGYPNQDTT